LLRGPVQIQSSHPGDNVSRVELLVREPGVSTDKLLRSDVPLNGMVLQQWTPEQPGPHVITVRVYDTNNTVLNTVVRTIEVIPDAAVSLDPGAAAAQLAGASGAGQPTVIPLTPIPIPISGDAAFVPPDAEVIQVLATSTPVPAATPIPRYPPPPPIPGVPPGPVQLPPSMYQDGQDPAQSPPYNVGPLLNLGPPVCDAAEYLGPFLGNDQRRIVIPDADDLAAPVVGGTTVFRAWQLQNVGTCTWGPGYELAFYGGRSMGSGGVAFESTFPGEPPRRNIGLDANRLIVPEGKPNQVAVLEVALLAPVTPGIHQSYWRMRNPHGVFFGPVVGVTMQVVRDCTFSYQDKRLYGAPTINRFVILGVGDVYSPTNRINVRAELGDNVILEWNIINATNFDIVFEDPTGNIETFSRQNQSGRRAFPVTRLGQHTITLFADNGSCVAQASVNVIVVPRAGEQFEMDILLGSGAGIQSADANVSISTAVAPGTVRVQWQHFDPEVNQIILRVDRYRRGPGVINCLVGDWLCSESREWQLDTSKPAVQIGSTAEGATTIGGKLPDEIQFPSAQSPEIMSERELLLRLSCQESADPEVVYAVGYCLEARKNGAPADPQFSNSAFYVCGNAAITDLPATSNNCRSDELSSAGITNQPIGQSSCTLNLLGREITIPFACGDVPIVAGVALFLLVGVAWFFFR
jgi:hypothetical protein